MVLCALLAGAAFGWGLRRLPPQPVAAPPAPANWAWPPPVLPDPADWSVFQVSGTPATAGSGQLAQRYRLAGTFFSFGDEAGSPQDETRKAVLDDLAGQRQVMLAEREWLDDFQVVNIQRDRVVLRAKDVEEVLWLSFTEGGAPATAPATNQAAAADATALGDEPALESNRFGKRVGDTRWVLQREALVRYYQEMLDDPERLAAVYISLKPDYDPAKKIQGYEVDLVGEKDFFNAVGLQQGDRIRKVNSMRMVSQARGEYFLSEFVKNRLNAVVLDVERNQKPMKLIYLIR